MVHEYYTSTTGQFDFLVFYLNETPARGKFISDVYHHPAMAVLELLRGEIYYPSQSPLLSSPLLTIQLYLFFYCLTLLISFSISGLVQCPASHLQSPASPPTSYVHYPISYPPDNLLSPPPTSYVPLTSPASSLQSPTSPLQCLTRHKISNHEIN